jgi:ankyrin repeat protein
MRELADRLEVLKFLLNRGLPINNIMYQDRLEDYYQNMYSGIGTPLHFAAEKGLLNSVKFLVKNGADPLIKDPMGKLALN